jgi:hypothetical protein
MWIFLYSRLKIKILKIKKNKQFYMGKLVTGPRRVHRTRRPRAYYIFGPQPLLFALTLIYEK